MKINEDIRNINARNHSAGHCIDVCFNRIDAVNIANGIEATPYAEILKPTKGYHFSDGCYVEYELFPNQNLSEIQLKSIPNELNKHLANLIQEDISTVISNCNKSEVEALCSIDTTHYPDHVRLLKIAGGYCPCGGTHISSTSQLHEVIITKIKCKKRIVKINYTVNY
jgi:Ser-tRNA(Ala) deacylase AlaX